MNDAKRLQRVLSKERIEVSPEELKALLEARETLRQEMGLLGRLWNWLGMRRDSCRRYISPRWGSAIEWLKNFVAYHDLNVVDRLSNRLFGRKGL